MSATSRDEVERVDVVQPVVAVQLRRLDPDFAAPSYAHPDDAGADLVTTVDVTLPPGERRTVPTGVSIALPPGYAAFVHPRSGLAARHGVTIVNAPGTVDAGYRGEIQVTLLNTDARDAVVLRRGDRVAQLVVQRVERVRFVEVAGLPESARGDAGFGSTGGLPGPTGAPLHASSGVESGLFPGVSPDPTPEDAGGRPSEDQAGRVQAGKVQESEQL